MGFGLEDGKNGLEHEPGGLHSSGSPAYVELMVTTNFSFLRGASHPEELIERAAELGYRAIAVTDLHSLAGIVRAHVAAKRCGIKLLVGAQIALFEKAPESCAKVQETVAQEAYAEDICDEQLPVSLCLYPINRSGYARLCRLLTAGKFRAPKGRCYLTLDDLREHQEGLLALAVVREWKDRRTEETLKRLNGLFDQDRLSLALWRAYAPGSAKQEKAVCAFAAKYDIPLAAVNDVHFHAPRRRNLQDALTCIRHRTTIEAAGYLLFANAERHLKTPREMRRLFKKNPKAAARSCEIAERINFSLDELKYEYPREICPEGKTPAEYLGELARKGARERYPGGVPPKVAQTIEHELHLIRELAYEKYFLTVYDIVRFAKERRILHQGRGAAANSAVCYCLGITAVDPERVDLLFERFISKERNEPPDIDIDFEHERREEVIQYLYERYGRHRAALVCEVISYRRKSAVRDLAKVFGLSLDAADNLVKAVKRVDYDRANFPSGVPSAEVFASEGGPADESTARILELAQELVGFPRHLSQHVGGMIVSERDLCEMAPIENAAMPGRTVIEWDKDDIDAMGMLKIDILALGMLTAIRKAFAMVNELRRNSGDRLPELALHNVPPEDPAVYDLICKADTVGVFQIESRAQMSMLPRLKPRCFFDLVIEVAIVRPGPIQGGMVHPYLRRRSGREKVFYPNEQIRKILYRTMGVPIFQEQAMQLSVVAAGFSPGEADELRRAMAAWKRNKNMIQKFREKLLSGMRSNGYSEEFAEHCFRQINGFGEYGFPQSHAASFALLVYVSAWLKKYYPAIFAGALINSQPMGFYLPAQIVADVKRRGVVVLPVDANSSSWDCRLEGGARRLRLGLRVINGLQQSEAEKITEAVRRCGKYRSVLQLWRDSKTQVRTLKNLARADAFQSFKLQRQQALWEIKKLRDEKLPLFESVEQLEQASKLPAVGLNQEVVNDYLHTGMSLKAHPLMFLRRSLERADAVTAQELRSSWNCPAGRRVLSAGLVLVRQRPPTASGVVFMTIEDETGFLNLVIYPDVFQKYRLALCENIALLVRGTVQREGEVVNIVVEKAAGLDPCSGERILISRDFH